MKNSINGIASLIYAPLAAVSLLFFAPPGAQADDASATGAAGPEAPGSQSADDTS